jgi:membrane fusion protein (multidrug efflux system)
MEIAKARVAQAETRLTLAEKDVARLKSVTVPGAIAQSDLDKQLAEQSDAAAALNLAKAELAKAELELGYTQVSAPLTGFIGKAEKEIGSLVDLGTSGLLATMHQVDPIYVSYQMTERDYLRWRSLEADGSYTVNGGGTPYLEITLLDGSTYPLQGTLDFEGTTVNTGMGSLELRATFDNPERKLKPGQFVRAHMRGYVRPNTIAIPQRAVSESPQGCYVYVLKEDNTAELRIIEPGSWSGADWIIESGISAGEKVIVDGVTKVQPGTAVTPAPLEAATDATENLRNAG